MSNTRRNGIEYVKWDLIKDTQLTNDLVIEFDNEATTRIYVSLRSHIAQLEGYYCKWNEKELVKFAFHNHFSKDLHGLINDVVEYLLHNEHFDEGRFAQCGILTSKSIQLHFIHVASKRKEQAVYISDYLCPGVADEIMKIEDKKRKDRDRKRGNQLESGNPSEDNDLLRASFKSLDIEPKTNNVTELFEFQHTTPVEFQQFHTETKTEIEPIHTQTESSKGKESTVQESTEQESTDSLFFQNEKIPENGNGGSFLGKALNDLLEKPIQSSLETEIVQPPPEVNSLGDEKKVSSGGRAKKQTHPARADVIEAWEKRFELIYAQSYENNSSIVRIIKCLEGIVKSRDHPVSEHVQRVIETWQHLLSNWNLLDEFYSKQISFEGIAKNIENILNQIRERKNGGVKNKQSNERPVSGTGKVPNGFPFQGPKRT